MRSWTPRPKNGLKDETGEGTTLGENLPARWNFPQTSGPELSNGCPTNLAHEADDTHFHVIVRTILKRTFPAIIFA